jgi:hypothetical protein
MRMVEIGEYLPKGFCIPHLSCEAAWRAWWMVTESLPLPLRFCSKKLPKGPNHGAECTRFSRIKKVMSFIASEIPQKDILSDPVVAFNVGWKNLAVYMHGLTITIDAHSEIAFAAIYVTAAECCSAASRSCHSHTFYL